MSALDDLVNILANDRRQQQWPTGGMHILVGTVITDAFNPNQGWPPSSPNTIGVRVSGASTATTIPPVEMTWIGPLANQPQIGQRVVVIFEGNLFYALGTPNL